MNRLLIAALLVGGTALVACEDGPNQTYSPPPANATWNDGIQIPSDGGVPAVNPGNATTSPAPFVYPDGGALSSGGNNANEICTQAQIAAINPVIDNAPILPPNQAANLNLAGAFPDGGVSWTGLTIQQAEKENCQGTVQADLFDNLDTLSEAWVNEAVVIEYSTENYKLDYIGVGPGLYGGIYLGTLKMKSLGCFNQSGTCTEYTVPVDGTDPISAVTNGVSTNLTLDWVGASNGLPASVAVFDQIYRAVMATYFPGYPTENPNFTCNQTGACIIGVFPANAIAYLYIPSLGLGLWAGPYYNQASENAINRIDLDYVQIMNYSGANPVLKMDAQGPTTVPYVNAAAPTTCQLYLGMNYENFFNNCVLVNPATNFTENLELFSAISHDEETYNFDINGVDVSFADTRLGKTQTLVDPPPGGCPASPTDSACPQAPDIAFSYNADQSTLSNVANDWQYNDAGVSTLHDLHGAGLVYNDYRTIAINTLKSEVCAQSWPTGSPAAADCAAWATPNTMSQQIANCIAPRTAGGTLSPSFNPNTFAPVGCTGMETLISADTTTEDDPVNVGPIAGIINPTYTLGMKMGHQQGSFCTDAMSRRQMAAQSYTMTCPGAASECAAIGDVSFQCAGNSCDPTAITDGGACAPGVVTCTTKQGTNPVPLTVPQLDYIGEVGTGAFVQNTNIGGTLPANPAPAGTEVVLTLPQLCAADNILPLSHVQVINAIAGGNVSAMPDDIQDNRFFFKQYGLALIQTLEAMTGASATATMPVAMWGPPAVGSPMPVQPNDLFFDSDGDGQFEAMEYVDRRFVCVDGAQDCAPVGATAFTCPSSMCDISTGCDAGGAPFCNSTETAQPPLDFEFGADVKDGIMNNYNFGLYMYRGERALYDTTTQPGYAPAKQSDELLSNIFGSPLLNSNVNAVEALFGATPAVDLTGVVINPNDYANALSTWIGGSPSPLSLSLTQQADSPLLVEQTFEGEQQALVQYPNPNNPTTGLGETLIPWIPYQPANGFAIAQPNNSTIDYWVTTASIDFTGITTAALMDYNIIPGGRADGGDGMEEMAVESTNFLGDVFLCYEQGATPPILAVRMYTPTQSVLDWLNANPQAYNDCGMVVRWSPYDNFVNLIESTTNGVRLQVTQGGGLGRIVGVQVYVPGLPFEE